MNRLEGVIATLDYLMSTKRKRHIMGGLMMSASLLFAGLVFTVITLKPEDVEEENDNEYKHRFIE